MPCARLLALTITLLYPALPVANLGTIYSIFLDALGLLAYFPFHLPLAHYIAFFLSPQPCQTGSIL